MLRHTHPGAAEDWWLDMWRELALMEIRQLQAVRGSQGKPCWPQPSSLSTLEQPLPSACRLHPGAQRGSATGGQGQNEGLGRLQAPQTCVSAPPAPSQETRSPSEACRQSPFPGLRSWQEKPAVCCQEQREEIKNDTPHCFPGPHLWCYQPFTWRRILLFACRWTGAAGRSHGKRSGRCWVPITRITARARGC